MATKSEKPKGSRGGGFLLKDLLPRRDVKGGGGKIVFGEGADSSPEKSPPSINESKRSQREEHTTPRRKRR
jgi:hypothetical protein